MCVAVALSSYMSYVGALSSYMSYVFVTCAHCLYSLLTLVFCLVSGPVVGHVNQVTGALLRSVLLFSSSEPSHGCFCLSCSCIIFPLCFRILAISFAVFPLYQTCFLLFLFSTTSAKL